MQKKQQENRPNETSPSVLQQIKQDPTGLFANKNHTVFKSELHARIACDVRDILSAADINHPALLEYLSHNVEQGINSKIKLSPQFNDVINNLKQLFARFFKIEDKETFLRNAYKTSSDITHIPMDALEKNAVKNFFDIIQEQITLQIKIKSRAVIRHQIQTVMKEHKKTKTKSSKEALGIALVNETIQRVLIASKHYQPDKKSESFEKRFKENILLSNVYDEVKSLFSASLQDPRLFEKLVISPKEISFFARSYPELSKELLTEVMKQTKFNTNISELKDIFPQFSEVITKAKRYKKS